MLLFSITQLMLLFFSSSDIFASFSASHCQSLIWEKGIPNIVQCQLSTPISWSIDEMIVNTTDLTYSKIYGYVPNGQQLYIYHPKHNQIIKCSDKSQSQSYCYRIILERCNPKICKNNGRCELADSKTAIERVTCICKYLSKGYRCHEKYESMIWVTLLLWLAVLFEVAMIAAAILRDRNQQTYKDAIHRRFVDIISEPDELFQ